MVKRKRMKMMTYIGVEFASAPRERKEEKQGDADDDIGSAKLYWGGPLPIP